MLRKKTESLEYLQFELLEEFDEVKHAIFLKRKENAPLDKEQIKQTLNCRALISGKQTHGINTVSLPCSEEALLQNCDGLMTKEKQLGLTILHADCQAAFFYDPLKHVIAASHTGWRGNVQNMYREMVVQLGARYRCLPQDLLVCISPSLGPCCAEFVHYEKEFPSSFFSFQEKENHYLARGRRSSAREREPRRDAERRRRSIDPLRSAPAWAGAVSGPRDPDDAQHRRGSSPAAADALLSDVHACRRLEWRSAITYWASGSGRAGWESSIAPSIATRASRSR